jgi:hypothetical protein
MYGHMNVKYESTRCWYISTCNTVCWKLKYIYTIMCVQTMSLNLLHIVLYYCLCGLDDIGKFKLIIALFYNSNVCVLFTLHITSTIYFFVVTPKFLKFTRFIIASL